MSFVSRSTFPIDKDFRTVFKPTVMIISILKSHLPNTDSLLFSNQSEATNQRAIQMGKYYYKELLTITGDCSNGTLAAKA